MTKASLLRWGAATAAIVGLSCTGETSQQDGASGSGGKDGDVTAAGNGAAGGCRSPDTYMPGLCTHSFDQQVARPATRSCENGNKVYTGTCGGYSVWNQTFSSLGDPVWCLYDQQGTLVGEKICSDSTVPGSCTPPELNCLVSGAFPSPYPNPSSCDGGLTSICDSSHDAGQGDT